MPDKPVTRQFKKTQSHWSMLLDGPIGASFTAEDLWYNAVKYFMWCDENPIYKNEVLRSGKETGHIVQLPVQRPYTISGLCLHLGVTREYLLSVARSQQQNEYSLIANRILEIIYSQKLELAITGVYNPIVSAKELGLNDVGKRDNDDSSPVINIVIEGNSPRLLSDEQNIELPSR